MRSIFSSKRDEFMKKNNSLVDMVTAHMAQDIERAIKIEVGTPVDTGQMKAATRSFRNGLGKHRVEINKEYAAVQEAGFIKGSRIQNYTTPGTSSGFFQRAIKNVWRRRTNYVTEAARALGLR
jgi:hypothetical protein